MQGHRKAVVDHVAAVSADAAHCKAHSLAVFEREEPLLFVTAHSRCLLDTAGCDHHRDPAVDLQKLSVGGPFQQRDHIFRREFPSQMDLVAALQQQISRRRIPLVKRAVSDEDRDLFHDNALWLIKNMITDNVMKAYLPMYLFEGVYQANWNGKVTDRYQDNGETKSRERFVNGMAGGNFSFFCLAYEGNDIPPELQNFARVITFNQNFTQGFDLSVLGAENADYITMEANTDKNAMWQRYGNQEVHRQAEAGVKDAAGGSVHDLNWSVFPQLMNQGQLVLVPFWFIYYFYRDTQYYFMMDGLGTTHSLTAPIDQSEKDEVNKYNWSIWMSLAILLLGIILLAAKVSIASIAAAVGGIASLATIIFYFVRRGQILKASRSFRDQAAQRFMQQQQ